MNSDDAEELLYTPPTKKDCKNQRDDVFNLNNNILHHVNNGQPINEDDKLLLPSAQDSIIICLSHNNNEMQTASTTEDNYTVGERFKKTPMQSFEAMFRNTTDGIVYQPICNSQE